jgi:hypothetical protein
MPSESYRNSIGHVIFGDAAPQHLGLQLMPPRIGMHGADGIDPAVIANAATSR